ncbi:hypothetical protein HDU82_008910 [Entophlyctis luteolus]|nr:hypothetical protein HDU82_008910 [Entophlyctis luteolus]
MLSFAAAGPTKARRSASPSPSRAAFRAPAYLTATATAATATTTTATTATTATHPNPVVDDNDDDDDEHSVEGNGNNASAAAVASVLRSRSHHLSLPSALLPVPPLLVHTRNHSPAPPVPFPGAPRASIDSHSLSTPSSPAPLTLPRRAFPPTPAHISNPLAMASSRSVSQRSFRVSSPPAPAGSQTSPSYQLQSPPLPDAGPKTFNLFAVSLVPSGFSPPRNYQSGSVFQFSEGRASRSDVDEMNQRSSATVTDDQDDGDADSLDGPQSATTKNMIGVDDVADNVPLFASLPRRGMFRSAKQPPSSPPSKQVFPDISPADAKPSKHGTNMNKSNSDDDEAPLGIILMQQKQQQLQQQQQEQQQHQQQHLTNSRVKSPVKGQDSEDDDLPLARFQAEHAPLNVERPGRRPTRARRKSSAQQAQQLQISAEATYPPPPEPDDKQLAPKLSPLPRKITTRIYIENTKAYKTVILTDSLQADAVVSELFAVAGNSISRDNVDDSMWTLFEVCPDFGIERPLRDWEVVSNIIDAWDPTNTANYLMLKPYAFRNTLMTRSIIGKWPKVEGRFDVEIKSGKFRRRYISLREDAIYYKERETDSEAMFAENPNLFAEYENIPARSAPPLRQPLSLGNTQTGVPGSKLVQELNTENVLIPSTSLLGRSLSVARKPSDAMPQAQHTLLSFSPKVPEKQENAAQLSRQIDRTETMKLAANKPLLSFEKEPNNDNQPLAQMPLRRSGTTLLTFPSQKRAFSHPIAAAPLAEVDNSFPIDSAVFEACDMPLSTTRTAIEAYDEASLREIQRFLNRSWEEEMAAVAADLDEISKQMRQKSGVPATVSPQEAMSPTSQKSTAQMLAGGDIRLKTKQRLFPQQEMQPSVDTQAKGGTSSAKTYNTQRAQVAPILPSQQLHRSRSQRMTGSVGAGATAPTQSHGIGAGGGPKIGNSGPLIDLGNVHNCTVCGCSEFKTIFGQNGVVMRDGRKVCGNCRHAAHRF